MAKAGPTAITWGSKWVQTLSFIVISPLVGFLAGFALMVACYWIFRRLNAARIDHVFRPAQLLSSALLSYSHGGNDAQKTMGIILGLLVASKSYFAGQTGWLHHLYVADFKTIPRWVEIGAYSMISLGTLFGGWRIVHTMGSRITKLRPIGGFAAETGGAIAIQLATHWGIPGEHHAHDHRLDRRRGRDEPALGGALGAGGPHRVGVDPHDPGGGLMAAISYWILHAVHPL